jgi:hypothetical protein
MQARHNIYALIHKALRLAMSETKMVLAQATKRLTAIVASEICRPVCRRRSC